MTPWNGARSTAAPLGALIVPGMVASNGPDMNDDGCGAEALQYIGEHCSHIGGRLMSGRVIWHRPSGGLHPRCPLGGRGERIQLVTPWSPCDQEPGQEGPLDAGGCECVRTVGGRREDRTPDLRVANAALSQLS